MLFLTKRYRPSKSQMFVKFLFFLNFLPVVSLSFRLNITIMSRPSTFLNIKNIYIKFYTQTHTHAPLQGLPQYSWAVFRQNVVQVLSFKGPFVTDTKQGVQPAGDGREFRETQIIVAYWLPICTIQCGLCGSFMGAYIFYKVTTVHPKLWHLKKNIHLYLQNREKETVREIY